MQLRNKILLDASALLALIRRERGYEKVEGLIASSAISAVNLSEVISAIVRVGISLTDAYQMVEGLVPEILDFTNEIAVLAGGLVFETQKLGLSLGDRSCIATAIKYNLSVYTTDKAWEKLNLEGLNIVLIR